MKFSQKEVIIVAGANGSGKTTFAKKLIEKTQLDFLNADEIAKELSPNDITKARISAGKKFFEKINLLIEHSKSFIIETTLSGNYLEKILLKLKENEYKVSIIFLFLESPELCIKRIKQRTFKGEHFVPDIDVKRRYTRGKINFWKRYRFSADKWYIIHNTENDFEEIAISKNGDFIILDQAFFEIFTTGID